jgi:hypothetical protein
MRHTGGLLRRAVSMVVSTGELWSRSPFLDMFRFAHRSLITKMFAGTDPIRVAELRSLGLNRLFQVRVLRLGFFQDGYVGVGVLPACE